MPSQNQLPRAVVMASGTGTNFAHVVECINAGRLALSIARVICNRENAGVLAKARAAGIEGTLLAWDRAIAPRTAYDRSIFDAVEAVQPDVVLLLGWMHILDARFIEHFGALINIHPAYLPLNGADDSVEMPDGTRIAAYRGAHALTDALAAGSPWAGATSHLVTLQVDRGPVLAREPMKLEPGESLEAAYARLRPIEYRVLEAGIARWLAAR